MTREEIKSKTRVDWYYMPYEESDIPPEKTHVGHCCIVVIVMV